jgi:hypothetical protein
MSTVQILQLQIGCLEAGSQTQPRGTITGTSKHRIPILAHLLKVTMFSLLPIETNWDNCVNMPIRYKRANKERKVHTKQEISASNKETKQNKVQVVTLYRLMINNLDKDKIKANSQNAIKSNDHSQRTYPD